jgi:hypothetical protein
VLLDVRHCVVLWRMLGTGNATRDAHSQPWLHNSDCLLVLPVHVNPCTPGTHPVDELLLTAHIDTRAPDATYPGAQLAVQALPLPVTAPGTLQLPADVQFAFGGRAGRSLIKQKGAVGAEEQSDQQRGECGAPSNDCCVSSSACADCVGIRFDNTNIHQQWYASVVVPQLWLHSCQACTNRVRCTLCTWQAGRGTGMQVRGCSAYAGCCLGCCNNMRSVLR